MKHWSKFDLPNHALIKMTPEKRKELGLQLPSESYAKNSIKNEAELQKLCEKELNRKGIAYLHLSFRAREKIGWPDLVFVVKGRPVAVELKSGKRKPTPEQVAMLAKMRDNGWSTYIVRTFQEFLVCAGWFISEEQP